MVGDVAKSLGKDPSSIPKGAYARARTHTHPPTLVEVGEIAIALQFQMKDENTQVSGSSQPSTLRPVVHTWVLLQWCQLSVKQK